MKREVVFSEPALADLLDINDYYLCEVSERVASNIIDDLEAAVNNLAEFPDMGSIPRELLSLGFGSIGRLLKNLIGLFMKHLPIKLWCMQYSMDGAICKVYSCSVFYEAENQPAFGN